MFKADGSFRWDIEPIPDEMRPLYRVDGDPDTGTWIGTPELIGERLTRERPSGMEGSIHYDSYERADGTTCEIEVHWKNYDKYIKRLGWHA